MGTAEEKLCETLSRTLGLEQYGMEDNFIRRGGNIFLAAKAAKESGITGLTPQMIMMGLTPERIGRIIKEKGGKKPAYTIGEAFADEYPMTPAMLYNYFCCEATGKSIDIMDLKGLWDLNDDVDIDRLREAIIKTIGHYEGLNIGFRRDKATFIRRKAGAPVIPVLELSEDGLRDFLVKAGSRKRNVETDDMIDATIMKFNGKQYLYMRIPHLVYDGMSVHNFLKDIGAGYDGGNPADEDATIFDEGNYQKKVMESGFYAEALRYYDGIFKEYPADLRKEMSDDHSTYFFNEKIGRMYEPDFKKYLKKSGLTFGTVLQAAFIVALSKDLKKDKLVYRIFHNGRYDESMNNLQGTVARPVLMLADIQPEEKALDFLQKLQYRYFESVYYDVVPFTEMIKRYPDIDSGIVLNYRGNLLGSTDIVLDGKPNGFSILGYLYGSDAKNAGHSHDILDLMLDQTADGFSISGNSGYYSKEKVLEIIDDMKKAFDMLLKKETVGQVLEAINANI